MMAGIAIKLNILPKNLLFKNLRNGLLKARTFSSDAISSDIEDEPEHYDVIVAGGGLVGTTLACAIGKSKILSDKRILLLEGGPKRKGYVSGGDYSNRVSALNHGTLELMRSIGAWDTIASERFKSVKQMQIWDASSDALITFNHDNFSDDIAYIIENDLVLHSVYQELDKLNNVHVKNQSKIENVELIKDGAKQSTVTLSGGEKFSCDLLIGADGANSLVRKKMKVDVYTKFYNQMGLVATLELSDDAGDNSVAWQRFIPTGTVALLPLNEKLSSLVWSTTPEQAKKLNELPSNEFIDALNDAFWKEYPKDSLVKNTMSAIYSLFGSNSSKARQFPPAIKSVKDNSRACFPLGFSHASSYVCNGAALIGDAAHKIHPLAGQGVNLGYGDVKCLVQVLENATYNGSSIGNVHYLLKYEKERLTHNVPMMIGIHGLQSLYSTTFSPIVALRSIGLQITQSLPPLKKLLMNQAMR